MGQGSSLLAGERGVSNVTAFTLLIGITLVGVVLILVTGYVSIGETNQQANMEVAEESMLQVDSALEGNRGNDTISLPDQLDGNVDVSNDQSYVLTLNENDKCTTGKRNLSSIEYEENNQRVAYEGGGVWRETESGTTMTSPPDVSYNDGSLSLSFVEINGNIQSTDELETKTNATRQRIHQENLTRYLYTDTDADDLSYVCRPSEVENATLEIHDSKYASAWARWAKDNHDSQLVTVTDPSTVEPGDTVTITYQLGDVSPAEFEVTDVRATRASSGDDVKVTATVENVGGLRQERDVEFTHPWGSETAQPTIGGGESKEVTFYIDSNDLSSGTHDLTVTADNSTTTQLELQNSNPVTDVDLDASGVPRSAAVGVTPSATVTVDNTNGGMTAFERLTLREDGDVTAKWNVTVPPGETKDVSVGGALPTDNTGTHTLQFSGDVAPNSESTTFDFTAGENGYFSVKGVSLPENPDKNKQFTVESTVKNIGLETLEGDITLEIRNVETDTVVETTTKTDQRLLGKADASGPESTTISASHTPTEVGNYSYRITTPNVTESGLIRVSDDRGPRVIVSEVEVPDTATLGNSSTFNVTVANSGDRRANQTVWLNNTNTDRTLESADVDLDPGEKREFNWDVDVNNNDFELGTNTINASTDNVTLPMTVAVQKQETFDSNDGTIEIGKATNVTITMEGAEFENGGYTYEGDGEFSRTEYPFPTVMTLVIENSTGTYEKDLWTGTSETGADVNHPAAERRMYRDSYDNVYKEDLSLEAGANVSLYATSYYCDGYRQYPSYNNYQDSGIDHYRGDDGNTVMNGYECTDRGDEYLEISNETNPNNVVIRKDGERVPKYDAAYSAQLTLDDMLGEDQVVERNGRGYLNLSQDEAVFLYELSDSNANPDPDNGPIVGDYNDAMARFKVTDAGKEVKTPAEFEIAEVDVPTRVDKGDSATMDVTINNTGGKTGASEVRLTFDNGTQTVTKATDSIAANQNDTVTFQLDTENKPLDSYNWRVSALGDSGDQRAGFITVGEPTDAFFQVDRVSGPSVADSDDSPEADIRLTNNGLTDDSQQVTLEATDQSGNTFERQTTVSLNSKESKARTLALPSDKGDYTYTVNTSNVTSPELDFFVGESNVYVPQTESITLGLDSTYDTGSRIDHNGRVDDMSVKLENDGTVGDERDVKLTVRYNNGTEAFSETVEKKQVGGGNLEGQDPVPAYVDFDDVDLAPGYYTYTVTVYDDTESNPGDTSQVSGEMFLRATTGGDDSDDDSPISVNSGTITIG